MADGESGALSVIFKFIDRFFSDYGFWLWVSVFLSISLLANNFGYISLRTANSDPVTITILLFGFSICMLSNALQVHLYSLPVLVYVTSILWTVGVNIAVYKLNKNRGIANFRNILRADSEERTWLIWYIFANIENYGSGTLQITSTSPFDSKSGLTFWEPSYAWIMVERHIFTTGNYLIDLRIADYFSGSKSGSTYRLFEAFDLFAELVSMTEADPQLKDEIRAVKAEMSSIASFAEFRLKIAKHRKETNTVTSIDERRKLAKDF
jgi:hypothetical protein